MKGWKISRACLLALHYKSLPDHGLWLAHGCLVLLTRLDPMLRWSTVRPVWYVKMKKRLRQLPYPSLSFPGFGLLVVLFAFAFW